MKTIYKYPLFLHDIQQIETYVGFQILTIQKQNDIAFVWILVDTRCEKQTINIYTFGTGQNINDDLHLSYAGTYMIENDSLVFHVFWDYK